MNVKRIFNKIRLRIKNMITKESPSLEDEAILDFLGISAANKSATSEVTYFTCMKLLSETLGKLSLKMYENTDEGIKEVDDNQSYIFCERPNRFMTAATFWATVEANRNHYGNAYVWIRRELKLKRYGGSYEIKDLWIMPSDSVTVVMDNAGIFGNTGELYYYYTDKNTGKYYVFPSRDVMHFKTSFTFDGVVGKPVRRILKDSIEGNLESQHFMNNLYKNGMTAKLALNYTGDLDDDMQEELVESFEKYTSGAENAGRIVPVPIGFQLQPLDVKLTDAQFFELKKFSALQIAAAFGIKPNQLNNYEKSSYSNSESQQLSFYVDTELFILNNYEQEINFKAIKQYNPNSKRYFKYNEKSILRTDAKTQKDIICGYVNNGLYTVNQGKKLLGLPPVEGGDITVMNGNYIPITMVGQQYTKGGEGDGENTTA